MLDTVIQQLLNAAQLGAVYALIALGYTMVYGIIQLINFSPMATSSCWGGISAFCW